MSSWESQLLSRIIITGDIQTPLSWGITAEDFLSSEGRGIWQHMHNYHQSAATSGSVLGPLSFQRAYPTYQLREDPSMTIAALCTEVRKDRVRAILRDTVKQVDVLAQQDPQAALNKLHESTTYLQSLGVQQNTDVRMEDAMGRILHTMELKMKGVDLSICPWPWEPLQAETGGIEKDDYVVIYGRPKSMKSWVLAALAGWAYEQRKKCLIYTKEMTADNIFMRIGAVLANIRYSEFRRGKLDQAEYDAIYDVWRMVHAQRITQPMVCLSAKDAGAGGDSVPWLKGKIELHKPDIVFIDGLYLMSNARAGKQQKDNERVRDISRDIRQMILDTKTPVICTLQANRKADENTSANLSEIAFSDAIGQDATLAMRVINEKNVPTLALVIGGSREFQLDGFRIFGIPATNFDYAGPLDQSEVANVVAGDTNDSDTDKAGKKGGAKKAKKGKTEEDKQLAAAAAAVNAMATAPATQEFT